jgi:uncharacterized protein
MQVCIERKIEILLRKYMDIFPVVSILGPRQSGKTTTAKLLGNAIKDFIYIDLENPADRMRINDLSLFFEINRDATICIDEAQIMPELFPELRGIIDRNRRNGQIILLGSASRELINKSAESLAGRIGYIELTPFTYEEIIDKKKDTLYKHWFRGGFPLSFLAENDESSDIWRIQYLQTYLERDFQYSGNVIPLLTIQRYLKMLANNQGQLFNSNRLGDALGISYHTAKSYADFFEKSFITRTLQPFLPNLTKRITKSPKIYIRDSGILHSLLQIKNFNHLLGHPVYGYSWEGYVIENLITAAKGWQSWFYRTATGNEIDLVLTKGEKMIAFECKAKVTPEITKGTYIALDDLGNCELFIVSLVNEPYLFKKNIRVGNLVDAINFLKTVS